MLFNRLLIGYLVIFCSLNAQSLTPEYNAAVHSFKRDQPFLETCFGAVSALLADTKAATKDKLEAAILEANELEAGTEKEPICSDNNHSDTAIKHRPKFSIREYPAGSGLLAANAIFLRVDNPKSPKNDPHACFSQDDNETTSGAGDIKDKIAITGSSIYSPIGGFSIQEAVGEDNKEDILTVLQNSGAEFQEVTGDIEVRYLMADNTWSKPADLEGSRFYNITKLGDQSFPELKSGEKQMLLNMANLKSPSESKSYGSWLQHALKFHTFTDSSFSIKPPYGSKLTE